VLLTNLADVVRAGGLVVHELSNWQRHHHGEMASVSGIILHHTGSSSTGAEGVVRNGRSDLAGPLAQLTLRRDGSVGIVSAGVSWHAGTGSWPSIGRNNGNARMIGIEAIYNGSDITPAQIEAYPRLAAALARGYGVKVGNIIGHREWAPSRKPDPGKIDLPAFRSKVAGLLGGPAPGPVAPPPSLPAASNPAPSGRPTLRDLGRYDPNVAPWVTAFQRWANPRFSYAGLSVDGWFGRECERFTREFQHRCGIGVDGVVGPTTWSYADRHGFVK
jgi:peptidoglycan hydrolase-like protein with peptidoglycan-binding domain